jgi:nucleotide-binding universal stress UspA family protein
LTALFGVRPEPASTAYSYSAGAALQAAEELAAAAAIARERLRARVAEGEPECTWCDVVGDSLLHGFIAESAYADLLVLGAPPDRGAGGGAPPGFVEAVILQSGTPALVVPHPHRQETIGECVLVAWNGSPQAGRALKAALPLLRRAAHVHVASWARQPPGAPFSGVDARWWLKRHGIDARVHRRDPAAHVDEALRALASEIGADLVVMGCYGRNRIREQVFGGVTRGLLARLPAPVLMAH